MSAAEVPKLEKFCELWKDAFGAVLGQLGVASAAAALSAPAAASSIAAEELERTIWGRFSVGGALRGELMLLAEKPAALQFAQLLMSEAPNPAVEFEDMHRDAFGELLRQVAGQTATFWKEDFGSEIQINFEASPANPFAPTQKLELKLSGEKIAELAVSLFLNGDLGAALSTPPAASDVQGNPAQAAVAGGASTEGAPLPQNLEILLDVELEATIRFGQREMLLRDIFGLMPGAVVELVQFVNEPAELLVAGRCIARGEVVVVDGNFGIRVIDVVSPGQRAELINL
jgi:flagellar motor switch protein FliN/FliY